MLSFIRYFSGLLFIVITLFIIILTVIDIALILCIMNFSVLAYGVGLGKV